MFGGDRRAVEAVPVQQEQLQKETEKQQQQMAACAEEWLQFLEWLGLTIIDKNKIIFSTQNQSDLSMCQQLNDSFKECKARFYDEGKEQRKQWRW